ncbi:aldehyde dehydrogenase family protein [Aliihoeflea sp. PC F10.4]
MNTDQFYIDGKWVKSMRPQMLDVINPATEDVVAQVAAGSASDVDVAVAAARAAFKHFARTSVEERIALLTRIVEAYEARAEDIAQAISREMGAPITFARQSQVAAGKAHLLTVIDALKAFSFAKDRGATRIVREAIGVAALITPWNWPLNQIATKVGPALAAGCTMVLKPSEIAPLSALIFAEVMDAAGTPPGVFNLVNGTGPEVGHALATHPDIAIVSLTGSTRAGIAVSKAGADTVKRVSLELGGKSPNIIFDDVDFDTVVAGGVRSVFGNSGQSCDAPTRMLVPRHLEERAIQIAAQVAGATAVGDPSLPQTGIGPVVSKVQYEKIQTLIEAGIEEGAALVAGGPGRPEGFDRGYFVRPTVFGRVDPDMRVAREEIFGPVLCIIPFDDEADAVRIANDSIYGLAAYVHSADMERARRVASLLEAGQVMVNDPDWDLWAPFGGYKQSGNGREYADYGMEEFLETKAIVGFAA